MAIGIRLVPETEKLLKRRARLRGCSESDVIREAVHRLADKRTHARKVRNRSKFRNAYCELAKHLANTDKRRG